MIVLDTHALVWWVNGSDELSDSANKAIEQAQKHPEGLILVSSISAWEIAMLVAKERLVLTTGVDDWLASVSEIDALRFVPVDNEVAVASTRLPGQFHPDPADRMIVALARQLSAPLVTADSRIRNYRHVKTIW